jgi:Fe-S-cluster containining protein
VPATFALSLHRDYACLRTGACCTSGWAIPVERDTVDAVARAVDEGRFEVRGDGLHDGTPATPRTHREWLRYFRVPAGPPAVDAPGALPLQGQWEHEPVLLQARADGCCVFLESSNGRSCAIHRHLGHRALPSACRHFPRVSLTDARGTFVRVSHYCPTAARLLFRDDVSLAIERDPPAFPADGEYEGLDATHVLPPLLRPGVLHSLASFGAWERFAVGVLARDDVSAEDALGLIGGAAEEMRAWTPAHGPVDVHIARTAAAWLARSAPRARDDVDGPRLEELAAGVYASVPPQVASPAPLADVHEGWNRFAIARWQAQARPVRRFLASHAFASWTAYQGGGLRTAVHALWAVLAVLQAECVRACRTAARPLDDDLLFEAIRTSDLWLLHLAAPDALVARLSRCEPLRPPAAWV